MSSSDSNGGSFPKRGKAKKGRGKRGKGGAGGASAAKSRKGAAGRKAASAAASARNDELFEASRDGDLEKMQELLSSGVQADCRNATRETPLFWACRAGQVLATKALIKAGASVRALDEDRSSPLHSAAASGVMHVVDVLLNAGAQLKTTDKSKQTPLHIAVLNNFPRMVSSMILEGARVNHKTKNGSCPLHVAAQHGFARVLVELLRGGADPSLKTKRGKYPRELAARGKHIPAMQVLDEYSAVDALVDAFKLRSVLFRSEDRISDTLLASRPDQDAETMELISSYVTDSECRMSALPGLNPDEELEFELIDGEMNAVVSGDEDDDDSEEDEETEPESDDEDDDDDDEEDEADGDANVSDEEASDEGKDDDDDEDAALDSDAEEAEAIEEGWKPTYTAWRTAGACCSETERIAIQIDVQAVEVAACVGFVLAANVGEAHKALRVPSAQKPPSYLLHLRRRPRPTGRIRGRKIEVEFDVAFSVDGTVVSRDRLSFGPEKGEDALPFLAALAVTFSVDFSEAEEPEITMMADTMGDPWSLQGQREPVENLGLVFVPVIGVGSTETDAIRLLSVASAFEEEDQDFSDEEQEDYDAYSD